MRFSVESWLVAATGVCGSVSYATNSASMNLLVGLAAAAKERDPGYLFTA
jgi:hypothetical protein